MNAKTVRCAFLIAAFLAVLTINAVSATHTIFLPPNKTLAIPDGVKLHLGDY